MALTEVALVSSILNMFLLRNFQKQPLWEIVKNGAKHLNF